jgi:hypothetical protein
VIDGRGTFHLVEARNPETVCCEGALLACALLTVGVPEHPAFPFAIFQEEISRPDRQAVTLWRWCFAERSSDGIYQTGDLIRWWHDDAWLLSHPMHEWTILRRSLKNMDEVAWRIRSTVPKIVIRRGQTVALIPANASPARRQHALGQLEGTIPLNKSFVEPEPAASP